MPANSKPEDSDFWDSLPALLTGTAALGMGALLIAAVTAVGLLLVPWLPPHSVAFLYILAIASGAVGFGTTTGLSAAATSFLTYNFFFVEPVYTFAISDPRDLFALFVFFGVAAATGSLAGRMRDVTERARRRARVIQSSSSFASRVTAAFELDSIAVVLAEEAAHLSGQPAIVLAKSGLDLKIVAQAPSPQTLESCDWQAANRSVRTREPAYPSAPGWPGSSYEFHPIVTSSQAIAVLGLRTLAPHVLLPEAVETVAAMLQHAAVAIDRIELEREKEIARQEAQSERLRSALLSSVSHDLKTPLASIQGAVTALIQFGADMPDAAKSDLLLAIEQETLRLSRFVINLLDMTRIESGAPDLQRDLIDLPDIVAASVARARRMLPSATIQLMSDLPSGLVRGQATLFEHVMLNILENAVQYSGQGAPVTVSVTGTDGSAKVMVDDEGEGIQGCDLPHVFEKFYRGGQSRGASGTGLGLTICKRIVEGMSGTISAESPKANGRGTRIIMRFPFASEPANPATDGVI